MTTFKFETYEDKYPEWAKHHKKVGLHVKRTYDDGNENIISDEELLPLLKTHSDKLLTDSIRCMRKLDVLSNATDYYLPLENQDYKDTITNFSPGASNTTSRISVRYRFLLEDALFITEQTINTAGYYTLMDIIRSTDCIEETLLEIAQDKVVQKDGIGLSEDDNYLQIVVVNTNSFKADIIDVEIDELIDHLIGIEIFDFELMIKD